MHAFADLTPTGRVRRLRRVAVRALAHYEIDVRRLTLLSESFNTLFRVSSPDATYVLRVGASVRVHRRDVAQAEQSWTDDLAGRGLRVPRIVPTRDGHPSVSVTDDDIVPGARDCMVLTWFPGRSPIRPTDVDDMREVAALAARLHEASPPLETAPAGVLDGSRATQFDVPVVLDRVRSPDGAVLRTARARAQDALDGLWRTAAEPPRLVHTDLTPSNVVRTRRELVAIDFQDLAHAHVEQDLANALFGATRGEHLDDAIAVFRPAYERVRPWPERLTDLLPHLIAARRLTMVNLAVHLDRHSLPEYIGRHAEQLRAYVA